MEMKAGRKYIVTKASDSQEFLVGDHFVFDRSGAITCIEAQGWMEKQYVPDAIKGMEFVLDKQWAIARREKLIKELQDLEQGE